MKRKIIKLGQATFVLSLPSKWIRENKLGKGDYVDVWEEENSLRLGTESKRAEKTLCLDINKLQDKQINASLEMAYCQGYSLIEVSHGPEITIYKSKQGKVSSTAFLQNLVNEKFINMEIIEQTEKRTVIKDLSSGYNLESAENIFQRIVFLLCHEAKEVQSALVSKDEAKLKTLSPLFSNTRKFTLYYTRILNSTSVSKDVARVKSNIICHLNYLNSALKQAALNYHNYPKHYSKPALEFFSKIVKSIEEMRDIMLKYTPEKLTKFLEERESVWQQNYLEKGHDSDIPLYWCMSTMMVSIWYAVKEIEGLHLLKL